MLNRFYSELLVLILLFIATSRFLYIKKVKTDPLCILPLLAFITSILNIFAFGISLFEMILLLLSFFVAVWNTRALLRFAANMVIDHYGFWFVFISTINLLLTIATFVLIIYFRPIPVDNKNKNFYTEKTRLAGTLKDGFYDSTNIFAPKTAFITEYRPFKIETPEESSEIVNKFAEKTAREPKKIIIFLPSLASCSDAYAHTFAKLARDGYTVYSGEFYSKDMAFFGNYKDLRILRQVTASNLKIRDPKEYKTLTKSHMPVFYREYETMLECLDIQDDDFVFIAGDGDSELAMQNIIKFHSDIVKGYFDLSNLEDYTTAGFGPIEQSNPFNANYLGYKRDKTLYMASHLATALENHFKDAEIVYEMKQLQDTNGVFSDFGENQLE